MLWPFKHFRKSPSPPGTIEAIYGMIVARAREPAFYAAFGVPDTVEGRFDMLLLHLWMVLRRLRRIQGGDELSQMLFDHFCADMDGNLREMGVGDLTVPKRMQKFGEAFYGRSIAYDAALDAGVDALAQALCKNILDGRDTAQAPRLGAYVVAALAALERCDDAAVASGACRLPLPVTG
jgi:cytochrome b pre-mRNA-processing protein 3